MKTTNSTSSSSQVKKVKGLDFLISGIIAAIFFLCPLFFSGIAAAGTGFEKMMLFYFLVLLGVVAWVTKGVITGELEFKRTPFDLPILAGLVIFIVAAILSVDQRDSLIGFYGSPVKSLSALVVFVLFYYLIINNSDMKKIKLYFWSLIASSCLVIAYSLLQLNGIFLLPMDFTKNIGFNPLGSLSGLTMFMVCVLPLLTVGMAQINEIHPSLQNKAVSAIVKVLLGIFIIGDIVILVLLSGFSFWPAAIVSSVIVLMFFLSKIIKISSGNLSIPIIVFLLSIIFLILGNFNFASLNLPAEISLSRGASWEIAKNSLKDNPIFGSGPATYYYSFAKYKSINFNNSPLWNARFDSASGVLNELLANVGGLGALSFIVVLFIALSICFLTLIKTDKNETRVILLSLFASFLSVIIFSLLFTLSGAVILVFMLISCLAVAAAIAIYPEKFNTLNLSFRASAKYALALAAIFLCVSAGVVILFTMGIKMYLADMYAMQSYKAGDIGQKIDKLNKAITLAPYQDSYYLALANNHMAVANQAAASGGDTAAIENNLSLAIERGKKAVELSPNKPADNESLALIYENASFYVRGALEWSESFYNKLMKIEPNNPIPYLRIALINMARANAESDNNEKNYYIGEAIKKFDEALQKKSDLAAANYGKGIAYEKLGQNDSAIDQVKQAVILSRDNIDYRFELGRLYFNRGVTQPNLTQNASENIAINDTAPDEEGGGNEKEGLSVTPDQATGAVAGRNDDLNMSEQVFLSILQVMPNHANALYSLAVLYQKIGEADNEKAAVSKLLEILPDDATKETVKQQFKGMY